VLLGENPSCWDELHAEVDRVLGDRLPAADDLAALGYTTAVIEESMRLLPPVWVIGREVQQEVTLGGHTFASVILDEAQAIKKSDPLSAFLLAEEEARKRGHALSVECDVRLTRRSAASVHEDAVADDEVVHGGPPGAAVYPTGRARIPAPDLHAAQT